MSLNKNKLIISFFLIIIAMVFYLILHGTDRLYIFTILKNSNFFIYINNLHFKIFFKYPIIFTNMFIKGYVVDIIWFTSLFLNISYFYKEKMIKYILSFLIGFFSEILQFLFPLLGTFDIYDILLYLLILLIFFLKEMIINAKKIF